MDEKALRRKLTQHGNARAMHRTIAGQESEKIRALVPLAIEAGMTKVEVCRLAQITRPALDAMLRGTS